MRPVILTFIPYYLPGFKSGGPIRTIANIVDALGDEFEFRIVTADRDSGDAVPYPGVRIDEWNSVGKAKVFYCSKQSISLRGFERIINATPHDAVYLNSFFHPRFTFLPLLLRRFGRLPNRPVLIAPRGEFSPGALSLKRTKKRLYLLFARFTALYRSLVWQASSEYEVADIRRVMGRVARSTVVAVNVPSRKSPESDINVYGVEKIEGTVRVVFLSRISPKKNLDFALKVLASVQLPVTFTIYGPIDDDGYWRYCESLIEQMPEHINVVYKGPVEHNEVPQVMASSDLFFLPTHGENYGHVILEALGAGTPVLISDTTPWRNLEEAGVGWDLPLSDATGFQKKIEEVARLSDSELKALRERAKSLAEQVLFNPEVIESNRQMFHRLVRNALT